MTTDAKTEAETRKAIADAEKAQADAKKAQADAVKAQMDVASSVGVKGDVTVNDKVGVVEASLLAARAVEVAACKIMEAIPEQSPKKTVLIYSAGEVPDIQAQVTYNAQIKLIENAFKYAENISAGLPAPPEAPPRKALLETAGLIAGAVQLVTGLLKTDYKFGSIETSFEKDTILIHALAGLIAGNRTDLDVKLPAVFSPVAVTDDALKLLDKFNDLARLKQSALTRKSDHETMSSEFTRIAKNTSNPKEKESLEKSASQHKEAAEAWKAAIALYDNFLSKYTTVDEKGVSPISQIIKEGSIASSLSAGNLLLVVKLHTSGGSYYTVKNIWTSITFIKPIYFMGGVVASFVLFDAKEGNVIASGVVPVHGGFANIDELQNKIDLNS